MFLHGIFLSQSLRAAIGPLQFSLRHWNLRNLTLHSGMLPYKHASRSLEIFFRQHSTFARLYNAAASPASRLRSAGSLAINALKADSLIYSMYHAKAKLKFTSKATALAVVIV